MKVTVFWDGRHCSSNLSVDYSEQHEQIIRCTQAMDTFRSAYGAEALSKGDRYFFEVQFLSGCNFKVGVSTSREVKESAFCDHSSGFGYYSAGFLRNGSKSTGQRYGESFKGTFKKDRIGVYLDLVEGKMFYSKNGHCFGTAFLGSQFLENDFYPACSCLTPDDSFKVVFPEPED